MPSTMQVAQICSQCGAAKMKSGRVMLSEDGTCVDKRHVWTQHTSDESDTDATDLDQMPFTEECQYNDRLHKHTKMVMENIVRTNSTIEKLQRIHEECARLIHENCEKLVQAVEVRRQELLQDLEELVNEKFNLLTNQHDQYSQHKNDCESVLTEILRRIKTEPRSDDRREKNVSGARTTIASFPVLAHVPIAVVAECETQPFVDTMKNFGGILETDLKELPTVTITNVNETTLCYSVTECPRSEEKIQAEDSNLQIQVAATAIGDKSLGWEFGAQTVAKSAKPTGSVNITEIAKTCHGNRVVVRARTMINEAQCPIRVSPWCKAVEIELKKAIAFIVRDPEGNRPAFPVKTAGPDFVSFVQERVASRWHLNVDSARLQVMIVDKQSKDAVCDLTHQQNPNETLAAVYEKSQHELHVILPQVQLELPSRLTVRLRANESWVGESRNAAVVVQHRSKEGDWRLKVVQECDRRWSLGSNGALELVDMYLIDQSGEKISDIVSDSDLMLVREHSRSRVVCQLRG